MTPQHEIDAWIADTSARDRLEEIQNLCISAAVGHSIRIGHTVAHPSDDRAHLLMYVRGGKAIVAVKDGGGHLSFPAHECFDPNVALKIGRSLK